MSTKDIRLKDLNGNVLHPETDWALVQNKPEISGDVKVDPSNNAFELSDENNNVILQINSEGDIKTKSFDSSNIEQAVKSETILNNAFELSDENGNVILEINNNGDLKTANFDSTNVVSDVKTETISNNAFELSDENGNIIFQIDSNGVIQTKQFNSNNAALVNETGSSLAIDSLTYVLSLKDKNNNILSSIDLPLESMVINGTYDNINKKIILTLQSGQTIDIPVGDLVSGLVTDVKVDNISVVTNNVANITSAVKSQTTTNNALEFADDNGNVILEVDNHGDIQTKNFDSAGLKSVAFTGSYNDLTNTPNINNGKLTIQANSTAAAEFTANQNNNSTLNIIGGGATSVSKTSNGEITISSTNTTYSDATTSASGLMSSTDKSKLDNIESGAQVNPSEYIKSANTNGNTLTLTKQDNSNVTFTPTFTDNNQKVKTSNVTFGDNDVVEIVAGTNISVTGDSTAKTITITSTGSGADTWRSIKLNGSEILGSGTNTNPLDLKAGSNVSLSNSNGEVTISATDTTYSAATTSAAGLMPQLASSSIATQTQSTKFLREDGSWSAPSYTTPSYPVTDVQVNGTSVLDGTAGKITIKSLDTTAATAQSTTSSESFSGTGTITLHKISKTGDYNDLNNKLIVTPNPSGSATAQLEKTTIGSTIYQVQNIELSNTDYISNIILSFADTTSETIEGVLLIENNTIYLEVE